LAHWYNMSRQLEAVDGKTFDAMESQSENPIDILQKRLAADWQALAKARASSLQKREELRNALESLDSQDTSIVVFGSLARDEFTSGSDIDWTLLVDGIADPEHYDIALEIQKHVKEIEKRPPGREGTFGGLTISHDLIHRIGGEDDTNRNTTQRILLLLESTPIGRTEAHDRVIHNVISRYVSEDYGLLRSRTWNNVLVPRFLQNDIARYWRTVTVDFAYKQRQRSDEGWALRVIKLRLSRKLTYISGLLMCFACEFDEPKPMPEKGDDDEWIVAANRRASMEVQQKNASRNSRKDSSSIS
jgi:predicted nucleotidyltransferase